MNATVRPFRLPRPSATMLAIAAALAAPAFCMLLPGAAYAQDKAKYMADSTSQGPGGKIGCPAGRRENLDNRVGLMPCVEDHAPVNGTPREPEKNLGACGGGNVSWAINGNTCAGWISNGAHGGKSTAISSNGNTGSAQFQCYDGRWSGPFSGSCVPPVTCPDTQVSWVGVDGTCAGTLPKTLANSAAWAAGVRMVTNNRPGNAPDPNNSYSAVCQTNGQWRVNSKKCDVLPSGCGAQTVYWNQSLNWDTSAKGCYGPTTAAQNGQTVRVTDQNPSDQTSDPENYATWACLDGQWSVTSGKCLEKQIPPNKEPVIRSVPVRDTIDGLTNAFAKIAYLEKDGIGAVIKMGVSTSVFCGGPHKASAGYSMTNGENIDPWKWVAFHRDDYLYDFSSELRGFGGVFSDGMRDDGIFGGRQINGLTEFMSIKELLFYCWDGGS